MSDWVWWYWMSDWDVRVVAAVPGNGFSEEAAANPDVVIIWFLVTKTNNRFLVSPDLKHVWETVPDKSRSRRWHFGDKADVFNKSMIKPVVEAVREFIDEC